jgi:hypothetical protein
LKTLIDNALGVTAVVVDSITTLDPGEPATVSASIVNSVLHLSLGIPRGVAGPDGAPGPQGPPFASVVVDSVATLSPGESATVTVSFDGIVHLAFGIPRGMTGADGAPGRAGEVTTAALNAAIAAALPGTSSNSNSVPTLDTPFTNDPPTLADLEVLRTAYNALVLVLRR